MEAEIAQLKDALARRQQIGVATQRLAITPSAPGHYWCASPQNCHVKIRGIAQAVINPHCSRLSQADIEIPARSRCICPTAYA